MQLGAMAMSVPSPNSVLAASARLDGLLAAIQPSPSSEFRRLTIAHYICGVIKRCFLPHKVEAFMFGSVPLRAVLPDGDIDISVFTTAQPAPAAAASGNAGAAEGPGPGPAFQQQQPQHPQQQQHSQQHQQHVPELRDTWASQLLRALEREASRPDAPFKIRDVQIIQAEVKLVKCVVSDVVVDVSFDTVGGLCTVAFLEAADRRIGRQHLFKRSILLLKAWCYYESRLLGAHHGLISSYALEVLVLYIFNIYHAELHTPLDVLRRFLSVLGAFDWERYCLALQGPVPLADLANPRVDTSVMPPDATPLLDDGFMQQVLQQYSVQQYLSPHHPAAAAAAAAAAATAGLPVQARGVGGSVPTSPTSAAPAAPPAAGADAAAFPLVSPHFPLKHLNIVDPLLPSNNLGRSVSKASFARVKKALALGARTLEQTLLKDPRSVMDGMDQFFRNTWRSPHRMATDNQAFLARLGGRQLPPAATEAVIVAAAAAGFPPVPGLRQPQPQPQVVQPQAAAAQASSQAAAAPGANGLPGAASAEAAALQQQRSLAAQQQQQHVAQLPAISAQQIAMQQQQYMLSQAQQPGAFGTPALLLQQQALQQSMNGPAAAAAAALASASSDGGKQNGSIAAGSRGQAQGLGTDSQPPPLPPARHNTPATSPGAPAAAATGAAATPEAPAASTGELAAAQAAEGQPAAAAKAPESSEAGVQQAGSPALAGSAAGSPVAVPAGPLQQDALQAQPQMQQQGQQQPRAEPAGDVPDGWQGGRPPLAQPAGAGAGVAATAPNTPVTPAALAGKFGVPQAAASQQLLMLQQGLAGSGTGGLIPGRVSPTAATAAAVGALGGGLGSSPPMVASPGAFLGRPAASMALQRQDSPHSFFGGDLEAMERNLLTARQRHWQQRRQQQQPPGGLEQAAPGSPEARSRIGQGGSGGVNGSYAASPRQLPLPVSLPSAQAAAGSPRQLQMGSPRAAMPLPLPVRLSSSGPPAAQSGSPAAATTAVAAAASIPSSMSAASAPAAGSPTAVAPPAAAAQQGGAASASAVAQPKAEQPRQYPLPPPLPLVPNSPSQQRLAAAARQAAVAPPPPPPPVAARLAAPEASAAAAAAGSAQAAPDECSVSAAMASLPAVRVTCSQPQTVQAASAGQRAPSLPQSPARSPGQAAGKSPRPPQQQQQQQQPFPRSPRQPLQQQPAPRSPRQLVLQQGLPCSPVQKPAQAPAVPPPLPIAPRGQGVEETRSPKTFAAALKSSSRNSSSASLASPAATSLAAQAALAAATSRGSSPKSASGSGTPSAAGGMGRRPAWGRGSSSNLAGMAAPSPLGAPGAPAPAAPAAPPAAPQQRSWSAVAASNPPSRRGSSASLASNKA